MRKNAFREDSDASVVSEFVDVADDHLNLTLFSVRQRLPSLEDRLDLVLGDLIPRHIEQLPAPREELAEQGVGDLLEDLAGVERLCHDLNLSVPWTVNTPGK